MNDESWDVRRLLKVSGGFWEAFAIHAGVKLDLFSVIGEGAMSCEVMAERLRTDLRGLRALLDALTAMGLLVRRGKEYANREETKALLVRSSPSYVGYAIMHHHHLSQLWCRLPRAVKSGRPVRKKGRTKGEMESFIMAMFNNAMAIAPLLAEKIDLSGRRCLLDLGGGPGTYAVHFCLQNPGLRATVFDLPATRPLALKIFERFRISERVSFLAGDYFVDGLGGPYDVAWLSQILHSLGPEECEGLLKKAVSSMEPGGLMLVHDFILEDTMDSPLFPALFSLNMLVNTRSGRSYSEGQIREMMEKAGVRNIRRWPFKGPMDSGIMGGFV